MVKTLGLKRPTVFSLCPSFYYQFDTTTVRVISEEVTLRSCLHQTGQWACLGNIFLIDHWYERIQPAVGITISTEVPVDKSIGHFLT